MIVGTIEIQDKLWLATELVSNRKILRQLELSRLLILEHSLLKDDVILNKIDRVFPDDSGCQI